MRKAIPRKHLILFLNLFLGSFIANAQSGAAQFDIMGMVMLDSVPAYSHFTYQCDIKLFEFVDSTGEYKFHSSTSLNPSNGMYNFGSLPTGKYLVHASTFTTLDYFPTYYPDHAVQTQAQAITLINGSNFSANINMRSVNYTGFDGASVYGNVSAITDSSSLDNVLIYLMDTSRNVLLFTYSDSLGDFDFTDLDYGQYLIHAEVLNVPCDELIINLTPNQATTNVNFYIDDENVYSQVADFRGDIESTVGIFPNPFKDELNISIETISADKLEIEVYNTMGQLLFSELKEATSGMLESKVSLEDLDSGIYQIVIRDGDNTIYSGRIMKVH